MLTAVWAAVIAALAAWVIAVAAGVLLMFRLARLASEAAVTVRGLRARGDALAEAVEAATRRANEQLTRTEAITASMDELTATLTGLNRRLTALAPAARTIADSVGVPVARAAALVYGIGRAVGVRRRPRVVRGERLASRTAVPRARLAGQAESGPAIGRSRRQGRRAARAVLTGANRGDPR